MELVGQIDLNATPEVIWAALFDPAVLKECFPGCKSVERKSESEYAAVLQVKVGPLNAAFNGLITLTDPEQLTAVTLAGTLNGAGAGFAKGSARIMLRRSELSTELSYSADIRLGGKLAAVGDRLFGTAVKRNIADFLASFAAVVDADRKDSASCQASL
ncbi:MAG TPA: carbon monoxide dehydrogenase subunit G [Steroidobacteraceae bacterium]|nr:carbon monoxide dehydrogenase subunit G [Steroidobacteraceae bacterium]